MYEAVIFDLDGTLVDSERVSFDVLRNMCEELGASFSPQDYSAMMGRSRDDDDKKFQQDFGLPVTTESMIPVRKRIKDRLITHGEATLKPGVREFLQGLSDTGYRLAIATASSAEYRETILKQLGIREYFEIVFSAEEVALPKPAPDIYLAAAKALGIDPGKCLVVEDAMAGVQSGCAAQMDVLGVRDRFFFQDLPGAKRIIDSFEEITVDDIAAMSIA